jgi:hypothetical protein
MEVYSWENHRTEWWIFQKAIWLITREAKSKVKAYIKNWFGMHIFWIATFCMAKPVGRNGQTYQLADFVFRRTECNQTPGQTDWISWGGQICLNFGRNSLGMIFVPDGSWSPNPKFLRCLGLCWTREWTLASEWLSIVESARVQTVPWIGMTMAAWHRHGCGKFRSVCARHSWNFLSFDRGWKYHESWLSMQKIPLKVFKM